MASHVREASSRSLAPGERTQRVFRTLWSGIVGAALCLAMVLGGVGGSYALFNDAVGISAGSVSAGAVGATAELTPSLTHTYADRHRVTTSSVHIQNTGNVAAQFRTRITLQEGSSAPLAERINVLLWPTTDIATCTASATPRSPYSNTLAAFADPAKTAPLTNELAPGASFAYCIRTTMDVANAPGIASGATVTPIFHTTATVGATWTATANTSATQTFIDDIKPSQPASLTASRAFWGTTIELEWSSSLDNVGVQRYIVRREGRQGEWTTTEPRFKEDGLFFWGWYTYFVSAVDFSGNVSDEKRILVRASGATSRTANQSTIRVPAEDESVVVGESAVSKEDTPPAPPSPSASVAPRVSPQASEETEPAEVDVVAEAAPDSMPATATRSPSEEPPNPVPTSDETVQEDDSGMSGHDR